MTAENSVDLDDAVRAFLAKGGVVQDLGNYADKAPPRPTHKQATRRRVPSRERKVHVHTYRQVHVIEAVVEGLMEGKSVAQIARDMGKRITTVYTLWARYSQDNPYAERLSAGRGSKPFLADDAVEPAILLYMELHNVTFREALDTLRVGEARALRLMKVHPVKARGTPRTGKLAKTQED